MADSPEALVNLALRRIGYPTPIGDMFEGSPASRVAVEIYGQTRDELMRGADWDFARQSAALTLQKTAPPNGYGYNVPWTEAYPPVPWVYQYAYPSQCLMVRSVRPTPGIMAEFDPQPNIFTLADDPGPPPAKVVLTNLAGAVAVFTGRVTNPTLWNHSFTEAIIAALATRLQAALAPEPNANKERMAQEMQQTAVAIGRPG